MRSKTRISGRWLLALCLPFVLPLSACGSANANATPTLSVDAIFTAAFGTFSAQQATELALTPPTATPSPTLFPTLPPPSPFATFSFTTPTLGTGGGTACNSSAFVSETIPDDTAIAAGAKFVKSWTLLNNGTCPWTTGYKLAFASGDVMGGVAASVTVPVPVGQQVTISVNLTAPTASGTYKGTWRMQNEQAQAFGAGIWVQIKVGAGSSTGTPATSTSVGPTATTVPPTATTMPPPTPTGPPSGGTPIAPLPQ
jgi:hypothetical protein